MMAHVETALVSGNLHAHEGQWEMGRKHEFPPTHGSSAPVEKGLASTGQAVIGCTGAATGR